MRTFNVLIVSKKRGEVDPSQFKVVNHLKIDTNSDRISTKDSAILEYIERAKLVEPENHEIQAFIN